MYAKILDSCVFLNNFNVMQQKNYNVIGVMSGTSLDGVDLALVQVCFEPEVSAKIIVAETVAYPQQWVESLKIAYTLSKQTLTKLDNEYTQYLAVVILEFIRKNSIENIDAVCSHGHTILHEPDQGFTLQIGNLPILAELIHTRVVCDFRVQDVYLGGQGAPLVPIGDQLLFKEYDYCLNLGGFANMSMDREGTRIAYDICAVNTVLNIYACQLGKEYDEGGAFAKAGSTHTPLLEKLDALPFYQLRAPKSLGIEWVHETVLPIIEHFDLDPKDVLATFTEHIAGQLKKQFKNKSRVLVTGGGAYNTYLLELLRDDERVEFIVPNDMLVEFKEALIFALLGVLKLENKVNTLASVTGARKDHSAGKIYLP